MDKSIELPIFVEEKQFKTMPVLCAQYSRDGKALAVVYHDYTLSIWDSSDLLTETREINEYHPDLQSHRNNTNFNIFLDWSASSRYLYYVVDRKGVMIDVFSPDMKMKIIMYVSVINISTVDLIKCYFLFPVILWLMSYVLLAVKIL